jgi:hypothetical protein
LADPTTQLGPEEDQDINVVSLVVSTCDGGADALLLLFSRKFATELRRNILVTLSLSLSALKTTVFTRFTLDLLFMTVPRFRYWKSCAQ